MLLPKLVLTSSVFVLDLDAARRSVSSKGESVEIPKEGDGSHDGKEEESSLCEEAERGSTESPLDCLPRGVDSEARPVDAGDCEPTGCLGVREREFCVAAKSSWNRFK